MTCPYEDNQMSQPMQWHAHMYTVRYSINGPSPQVAVFSRQLCLLHNWKLGWTTSQIRHGAVNRIHDTQGLRTLLHSGRYIHWLGKNSCDKDCGGEADDWKPSDAGSIYAERARKDMKELSQVLHIFAEGSMLKDLEKIWTLLSSQLWVK